MKRPYRLPCIILMFALVLSAAAVAQEVKPYPVSLEGKKIAIFIDDQYQVGEAYYTPLRFEEAGAEVTIVSHSVPVAHRFRPTFTHYMKTDITPQQAVKTAWDGVVVIGGFAPLTIREDPDVIRILRDTNDRKGMVSAICHGVCVLVTADLIRGKNVTGNVPRSIEFTNAGATFHEIAPQVDGNVITAIGPGDNGPYLDAMVHWFEGGEAAAKAHQADQYLKGKKIAIVIDNRYKYSQVAYPSVRLRHNGASVYFIAVKEGEYSEYRGVLGTTKADMNAQDATNEQFDAIVLVGHYAADTYRRHADVRQFLMRQMQRGTMVASINWGHTLLIESKLAKDYEFATTWGMQNDIKNAGGTPVLEPAHRDRNLITCASDDDLPHLMRLLVNYLVTGE